MVDDPWDGYTPGSAESIDGTEAGALLDLAIGLTLWWRDPAMRRIELVEAINRKMVERYGLDAMRDVPVPERPQARRKARIPTALRQAVYERDGHACVDCGATVDLTCDHIHPESLGGPTTLENLATRCRQCNSRKGVRTDVA